MELYGIVLGRLKAMSLMRYHMNDRHGVRGLHCLSERILKLPEIVSVHRSQVTESPFRSRTVWAK